MNAINWNAIGAISTSIAASVGVFGILVAFRAVKIAEASSKLERRTYLDRILQKFLEATWEFDAATLPYVPGGEFFVDEAGEILPEVVPPPYLLGSSDYLRLHLAVTNAQTSIDMFKMSWAPRREDGLPRSRMEIALDGMEWALWRRYHSSLERPTFSGTCGDTVEYLIKSDSEVLDANLLLGILSYSVEEENDRDKSEEDCTTSSQTAYNIGEFFKKFIIEDFKRVVDEDSKMHDYDRKRREAKIRWIDRPVIEKTNSHWRPWKKAKTEKV